MKKIKIVTKYSCMNLRKINEVTTTKITKHKYKSLRKKCVQNRENMDRTQERNRINKTIRVMKKKLKKEQMEERHAKRH